MPKEKAKKLSEQPTNKSIKGPINKNFSSGPTAKPAGWDIKKINTELLGRSHRSSKAVDYINNLVKKTRSILKIPDSYMIGFTTGSATAAMEILLWNLVGKKNIDVFVHDVFSQRWMKDIKAIIDTENKFKDTNKDNQRKNKTTYQITYNITKDYSGKPPNISLSKDDNDAIFNFNGSTTGVSFENTPIPSKKSDDSIWICDITSAVFAMNIPWKKLDAIAFSLQKALGAEAGHGVIVLSPKAVKRINSYTPNHAIPSILNLKNNNGKLNDEVFKGKPINTPSLLCLAEYELCLELYKEMGGLCGAVKKTQQNRKAVLNWLEQNSTNFYSLASPEFQSSSVVCIALRHFNNDWNIIKEICNKLQNNDIVYDINNHIMGQPSFRLWTGPNIDSKDIISTLEWIKTEIAKYT